MFGRTTVLMILLLSWILVACGRGASVTGESSFAPTEPEVDFASAGGEAEESVFGGSTVADSVSTNNLPSFQAQERLIIRTGNLSVVVEDTEEALANITNLVEENGGWVVSSNVFQFSEDAKRGEITVRIPADGFSHAIEAIKAMALEVTSESTSGQDVTDEFVDLSSRLSNLEATAARVRNFLDETRNVEEALAVNAELSRLEEQIEVLKGRMQFLEQSAAYSTINVSLTPDELSRPLEVAGWRPQGIARDAIEALIGALQGLAGILIWLVIFLLPLFLLIAIPLWLTVRYVVRRRRRRVEAAGVTE